MPASLYYYKATGRANAIRLALAAANIPFNDVYPEGGFPPSDKEKAEWRKLGRNTTTNVPMLQMDDGKVYTQSQAILRFVGRTGNLMPQNESDLFLVDKLLEDAEDLRKESYKCFIPWGAPQESADAFIEKVLPLHLGNLERQLKESSGGYFIGNSLTLADVAVYDAVVNFGSIRVPTALDDFADLNAWKERVEKHEGIQKYLKSDAYADLMKFGPETLGK
ncbi:hypothetical protein ACHAXS_009329 [Conticribra weissflogii]